jgi:hypothetical protein
VPEDVNEEIAHRLAEHEPAMVRKARWEELLEIAEAVVLALVAVATAWSGYQAAKWDGRQAELYGQASATRIKADEASTAGGQERLLDVSTFNTWIQAKTAGDHELAALYVKRFSPEYRVAFDAWLKTDPLSNPDAPAGPIYMAEYHNALLEQAAEMNDEASAVFDEGTRSRQTAEQYVRTTVLLATVLFLIALSQRFKLRNVRVGVLVVATGLMVAALYTVVILPRA